ncbi:unnamed protein product [Symbiodinium sp. CCMP2456]|nr:unnamed protein product [Symbiodinium sp. CCMP2456]
MYGLNAILSRNSYVSWGNGRDFIFTGNRDFQGGRQCWLQHDGTSSAPVAKPRPPAVKMLSKGTGPLAGSRRKLEQSVEYWRSLGRHDTMEDAFVDAAITRVMQKPRPQSAIATRRPTPRPSKRPEKASPWAAWQKVQPEEATLSAVSTATPLPEELKPELFSRLPLAHGTLEFVALRVED